MEGLTLYLQEAASVKTELNFSTIFSLCLLSTGVAKINTKWKSLGVALTHYYCMHIIMRISFWLFLKETVHGCRMNVRRPRPLIVQLGMLHFSCSTEQNDHLKIHFPSKAEQESCLPPQTFFHLHNFWRICWGCNLISFHTTFCFPNVCLQVCASTTYHSVSGWIQSILCEERKGSHTQHQQTQ